MLAVVVMFGTSNWARPHSLSVPRVLLGTGDWHWLMLRGFIPGAADSMPGSREVGRPTPTPDGQRCRVSS